MNRKQPAEVLCFLKNLFVRGCCL